MHFFLLLEQGRAGHVLTQWRAFKSSYTYMYLLSVGGDSLKFEKYCNAESYSSQVYLMHGQG